MGFNIQSDDTQNTLNDFTSVVNTSVEKAKNQASLICSAANTLTVDLGSIPNPNGDPIQCQVNVDGNVNITQLADADCTLDAQFTTNFQNALTNNVKTDVEQWIKSNINSNQGWLAIAFDGQFSENQNAETVATTISNGLVADITNTCSAQLTASNNSIVSICGNYRKDFNFNQSAFVTNVTSCIANNTISFISSNTVLNNMSQHADSTLSSSQEGLSSIFKWLILAGVILAGLIIVGVLLFFIFGSKGGGTPVPFGETIAGKKEKIRDLKRAYLEKEEGKGRGFKGIEDLAERRVK